MCFKITATLREYYRYRGVSAEYERRGYGSSRTELAWAYRRKQTSVVPLSHRSNQPQLTSGAQDPASRG